MPNYNSSEFIQKTIKSVLSQTFTNWELIIIDDNSNNKTKEILKNFTKNKKIKIYFLKKNKGDGYCRLFGINKAKSKIIAFIDSDDLWKKNKLKLQYDFMQRNNYEFTYTGYTAFKESDLGYRKEIIPPDNLGFKDFIKNTSIATSSMMIKKSVIKDIKISDSPIFDDFNFKCQILRNVGYAFCLNKNLLLYRIRNKSLSQNKIKNIIWLWKINKSFNSLSFFENLSSILSISINSLKKYGLK